MSNNNTIAGTVVVSGMNGKPCEEPYCDPTDAAIHVSSEGGPDDVFLTANVPLNIEGQNVRADISFALRLSELVAMALAGKRLVGAARPAMPSIRQEQATRVNCKGCGADSPAGTLDCVACGRSLR